MSKPQIALVGNLGNVAYQTCKFLRRREIQATVFIEKAALGNKTSNPDNIDPDIMQTPPAWVKIIPPPLPLTSLTGIMQTIQGFSLTRNSRLLRALQKYDLIVSFCCEPWFIRQVDRPYISFATGSDLRELAVQDTPRGRHAKDIFQNAEVVFFGADPGSLDAARRLKLKNSYFPYPLLIDTDFYAPDVALNQHKGDGLLVFHPTNLDWTYTKSDRWTKGNDRLFRAFARLVKEGHRAKMIYLERGIDVSATRELVEELGIGGQLTSISGDMSRSQLKHYFNMADIVADQFNISLGVTGLEAMSCGRPVLVWADAKTSKLSEYHGLPPVLNSRTEEEIYDQLKRSLNSEYRRKVAAEARDWIIKFHGSDAVVDDLLWHFESVVGRTVS